MKLVKYRFGRENGKLGTTISIRPRDGSKSVNFTVHEVPSDILADIIFNSIQDFIKLKEEAK